MKVGRTVFFRCFLERDPGSGSWKMDLQSYVTEDHVVSHVELVGIIRGQKEMRFDLIAAPCVLQRSSITFCAACGVARP